MTPTTPSHPSSPVCKKCPGGCRCSSPHARVASNRKRKENQSSINHQSRQSPFPSHDTPFPCCLDVAPSLSPRRHLHDLARPSSDCPTQVSMMKPSVPVKQGPQAGQAYCASREWSLAGATPRRTRPQRLCLGSGWGALVLSMVAQMRCSREVRKRGACQRGGTTTRQGRKANADEVAGHRVNWLATKTWFNWLALLLAAIKPNIELANLHVSINWWTKCL